MKDNNKDNQKLKNMTSEAVYKSFVSKQPKFFNKIFNITSNSIAYLLGVYVVLTLSLYVIVHFNIGNLFKSKTLLLEYDSILYSNFLSNFFFGIMITSNFYLSKKDYQGVFSVIQLISLTALYFTFSSMTTKDFLLLQMISLMKITNLTLGIALFCYIVYFYVASLLFMRGFLSNNFTFEEIYHEISLRTDMMKFSYNNFLLKFKINKVFPGLLYPRSSFYYVNCSPPASVIEKRNLHCSLYKNQQQQQLAKCAMTDESESVQMNVDCEEKQKFISKSSSKNAYLSTMGEY